MGVFTPVSAADARSLLAEYEAGALVSLAPIPEGVQNTNYRLVTDAGAFVLTLFEQVTKEDLPFCLGLMEHLAARGAPTPPPLRTRRGDLATRLNGRAAALVAWRDGAWPRRPTPDEATQAGARLADLHLAGAGFPRVRANPLDLAGWARLAEASARRAEGEDAAMLAELTAEIGRLRATWPDALPAGPIHADYFPDNVLFADGRLTAVIDFYFACTDAFAYDLAIALGAWGFDDDGTPRAAVMTAFDRGYRAVRPLSPAEDAALPLLCRGAAVRFSMTRLHDRLFHEPGWQVSPKDPAPYLRRLRHFQDRAGL